MTGTRTISTKDEQMLTTVFLIIHSCFVVGYAKEGAVSSVGSMDGSCKGKRSCAGIVSSFVVLFSLDPI